MKRVVGCSVAGAALSMLVACGGGRPNGGSSPAPAPPAKPTATPLAIKVKSHRVGQHYVYLTEQKNDRVVYVLRADSTQAERLAAGTAHSTFVRPHITFHQPGGRTLVAESPVATVDEETKSVVMSGGVRARTHDGLTLTCDELRYEDATERIHGTGHVVLTTPQGERLSGDVIDADSKLDHVQMHGVSPR